LNLTATKTPENSKRPNSKERPRYRRLVIQTSSIVAIAVAVGLGASSVPSLLSSAHAVGMVSEGKEAMKGSGTSLTDTTGKLKTDVTKTKDDAKALDLEKTRKGVGDVKEDVKRLKDNAKGMMTNPMGQ